VEPNVIFIIGFSADDFDTMNFRRQIPIFIAQLATFLAHTIKSFELCAPNAASGLLTR
jgi:hypothetical protein